MNIDDKREMLNLYLTAADIKELCTTTAECDECILRDVLCIYGNVAPVDRNINLLLERIRERL